MNKKQEDALKKRNADLNFQLLKKVQQLEIESALESVRVVAMQMKEPGDMLKVCKIISQQLKKLGLDDIRNVQTAIINKEKEIYLNYEFYPKTKNEFVTPVEYNKHTIIKAFVNKILKDKEAFFTRTLANEKLKEWVSYQRKSKQFVDPFTVKAKSLHYYWYSIGPGALGISTYTKLNKEGVELFKRFRSVFTLAYQRFVDIQQAAAQTKEAEIELALERVRVKTMAMQKSEELAETSFLLFEQFKKLGRISDQISIGIFNEAENMMDLYTTANGLQWKEAAKVDLDEPVVLNKIYTAWKQQKKSLIVDLTGDKLRNYNAYRKKISGRNYKEKRWVIHIAFFSKGVLTYSISQPHDTLQLLERFAGVFEGTYTRFLDLQKAEAQAREAKIEAALEKVRSVALGLKKSDELLDIAEVLYNQLYNLGFKNIRNTIIDIHTDDKGGFLDYDYSPQMGKSLTRMNYNDHPIIKKQVQEIHASRDGFYEIILEGKDLEDLIALRIKNGEEEDERLNKIKQLTYNLYSFGEGEIGISNFGLLEEEQKLLLKRFRNVFSFAYYRYSELKEAETRTRELQIVAALEKVRSRSLSMHKSDELVEVVTLVFQKLQELKMIVDGGVTISIYDEVTNDQVHWVAAPELISSTHFNVPYADDKIIADNIKAKKSGIDFFAKTYPFDEKNAMLNYLFEYSDYKNLPKDIKNWVLQSENYAQSIAFSKNSSIFVNSYSGKLLSEDEAEILKRFAKVFEQTYIRFLDLQKAEDNARESQIEAGLERVRSKTLAMQKSDELAVTAAELFRQLIHLGITPNRLYIGIIRDESGFIEMWATNEDGSKIGNQFNFDIARDNSVKKMYDAWKQQLKSITIIMEGEELSSYFRYLHDELNIPFSDGLLQKRRIQTIAYFSTGFIGMASPDEQPAETTQLLERFAAVFNLTFTRFSDLKIAEAHAKKAEQDLIEIKAARKSAEVALAELQSTQRQLIQSEKMASLGELTAGIAHEIQNPLNFINNFSEVNKELLEEMKVELDKGNMQEAKVLADDVINNEEKINHHGKRADAIVKGMLQHSRSSNGVKEPTDINALCDEYLRLSYHGLRAKDKSFNATMKTDFDESVGNVNVISQDIGRVVLNLLTNAFYAVHQKQKELAAEKSSFENLASLYEPTVSISTKKIGDKVEIKVSDNGKGIPQKIIDKIFQPFFTTKPTGQGTGLGLSMSYDIITKGHGGNLAVETKEDVGTAFIINLPI